MSTMLYELTNTDRFAAAIADGRIDMRVSREYQHPLAVCCYSKRCQMEGLWEETTTMLARGLVLEFADDVDLDDERHLATALADAQVIARGIRKFFTVKAAQDDWGRVSLVDDDEGVAYDKPVKIDLDAPSSVSNKVDGALNVAFPTQSTYHICTKGAFCSDEARIGDALLHGLGAACPGRNRGAELRALMDTEPITTRLGNPSCATREFTPLFEVVCPEEHHVIDYGDFADVVFLGLVHIEDGRWIPAANLGSDPLTAGTMLARIPERCGFVTPDPMPYATLGEALAAPELDNHEGMVVTSETAHGQTMYKVKYPTFLKMQAVRHLNRFGQRAIEGAIDDVQLFHGDAHKAVVNAVLDLMKSRTSWTEDMAELVAMRIDEEYSGPARRLYDAMLSEATALGATCVDVTSREGRKLYAKSLTERVREGEVSRADQAAYFLIPSHMGGGIPSESFDHAMRVLVDNRFGR